MKFSLSTIIGLSLLWACSSDKRPRQTGSSSNNNSENLNQSIPGATEEIVGNNNPENNTGNVATDQPTTEVPGISLAEAPVAVGVKNFEQINLSLSVLTGIPTNTAAINTAFLKEKGNLPTSNDIKAFSSAQVASILKLSATYCNSLITDAALANQRTAIFGTTNFAQPTATTFADQKAFIDNVINKFWGTGLEASLGNKMEYVDILDGMITSLKTQAGVSSVGIGVAVCAASLSSAPVILY